MGENGCNECNYVLGNTLGVLAFSTCIALLTVKTVVLHNPAQEEENTCTAAAIQVTNSTCARPLVGLPKILGCGGS